MKVFSVILAYWIIGCLLVGAGLSQYERMCPGSGVEKSTVLMVAALWPMTITYAMFANTSATCGDHAKL